MYSRAPSKNNRITSAGKAPDGYGSTSPAIQKIWCEQSFSNLSSSSFVSVATTLVHNMKWHQFEILPQKQAFCQNQTERIQRDQVCTSLCHSEFHTIFQQYGADDHAFPCKLLIFIVCIHLSKTHTFVNKDEYFRQHVEQKIPSIAVQKHLVRQRRPLNVALKDSQQKHSERKIETKCLPTSQLDEIGKE